MKGYLSPIILQYGRLLEGDSPSFHLKELVKDFDQLQPFLLGDSLGWSFLSQGGLSGNAQKRVMAKLLDQTKAHASTRRFIFLLIQNRRLGILPDFMDFARKKLEADGRDMARLITAKTFASGEFQQITDTLNSQAPQGTQLHITVDPQLLGGAILFWRGLMIDASTRTLLSHLKT